MRNGFTTGTAAAAAARAHARFLLNGGKAEIIDVILPDGGTLRVPIDVCTPEYAGVIKDAGDDPDVTHGTLICASVNLTGEDIIIEGGQGIGTVTKPGLQLPVGSAAINPVPRQMIRENIRAEGVRAAVVTISVPDGERLAEQTFNSRIGIKGGISIIGTTGIVVPMSKEALTATIACEIDVLKETGADEFTLVPGKIGEKHIQSLHPDTKTVIISNFAGFALSYAREKGVNRINLAGHPGKLAKLAMGYYDTHSKHSPMAQGFMAEKLGLKGTYNTTEEICAESAPDGLDNIAELVSNKVKDDFGFETCGVTLFDMAGNLKGRYYG